MSVGDEHHCCCLLSAAIFYLIGRARVLVKNNRLFSLGEKRSDARSSRSFHFDYTAMSPGITP
jgi:hypothetical protein